VRVHGPYGGSGPTLPNGLTRPGRPRAPAHHPIPVHLIDGSGLRDTRSASTEPDPIRKIESPTSPCCTITAPGSWRRSADTSSRRSHSRDSSSKLERIGWYWSSRAQLNVFTTGLFPGSTSLVPLDPGSHPGNHAEALSNNPCSPRGGRLSYHYVIARCCAPCSIPAAPGGVRAPSRRSRITRATPGTVHPSRSTAPIDRTAR